MQLDLSDVVDKLFTIEKAFNETDDPLEKYALIKALNEIAEKDIPIHGWWEDHHLEMMIHGIKKRKGLVK